MKELVLDNRLQSVFDEILPCKCVVDIGTDHGKIPIKAVVTGVCDKAIATDISAASLAKARYAAVKFCVADRVDSRVGDGLAVLNANEYDTVVIAGMGGLEIVNILKVAKCKFSRYILLPHRNAMQLREYLAASNICCNKDYMIECNNKYYNLMVASEGRYSPDKVELRYGKSRNTPIFKGYLHAEIEKVEAILAKELSIIVKNNKLDELKELKDMYESFTNN